MRTKKVSKANPQSKPCKSYNEELQIKQVSIFSPPVNQQVIVSNVKPIERKKWEIFPIKRTYLEITEDLDAKRIRVMRPKCSSSLTFSQNNIKDKQAIYQNISTVSLIMIKTSSLRVLDIDVVSKELMDAEFLPIARSLKYQRNLYMIKLRLNENSLTTNMVQYIQKQLLCCKALEHYRCDFDINKMSQGVLGLYSKYNPQYKNLKSFFHMEGGQERTLPSIFPLRKLILPPSIKYLALCQSGNNINRIKSSQLINPRNRLSSIEIGRAHV